MHHSSEKRFVASTVCAVAGCKPVTLRAWRLRNGLFPETQGSGQWNLFSLVDICIVRLVVELTAHGIDAADAVRFAQREPSLFFSSFLAGDKDGIGPVFGFCRDDDGKPRHLVWGHAEGSVAELMKRIDGGPATLFDARIITGHVLREWMALRPETIATRSEALSIVAGPFADYLDPNKEEPAGSKTPPRGRK